MRKALLKNLPSSIRNFAGFLLIFTCTFLLCSAFVLLRAKYQLGSASAAASQIKESSKAHRKHLPSKRKEDKTDRLPTADTTNTQHLHLAQVAGEKTPKRKDN